MSVEDSPSNKARTSSRSMVNNQATIRQMSSMTSMMLTMQSPTTARAPASPSTQKASLTRLSLNMVSLELLGAVKLSRQTNWQITSKLKKKLRKKYKMKIKVPNSQIAYQSQVMMKNLHLAMKMMTTITMTSSIVTTIAVFLTIHQRLISINQKKKQNRQRYLMKNSYRYSSERETKMEVL